VRALVLVVAMTLAVPARAEKGHRARGIARAPAAAAALANPLDGDPAAVAAGGKLYGIHCARCHDADAGRGGRAPVIPSAATTGRPGALFWFITNGDLRKGMPSWSRLPRGQRWQIVTFLDSR
jgi:mono/diheme cytochrome c family protein